VIRPISARKITSPVLPGTGSAPYPLKDVLTGRSTPLKSSLQRAFPLRNNRFFLKNYLSATIATAGTID
jgi:hypothetical protein